MADRCREIMTSDVRRMRALSKDGLSHRAIATVIGCTSTTVTRHLRDQVQSRRAAADRYSRFVALASAYVPTFGGGR